MKIEHELTLPAKVESQKLVCKKSGICYELAVPALKDFSLGCKSFKHPVLEYDSPLAYWSNVQGFAMQSREYLVALDKQVLAGLVIVAYSHFELIDFSLLSAVEANAVLRTAHEGLLAQMLRLTGRMSAKSAKGLPVLYVEWADCKQLKSIDGLLQAYYKRLQPYFNEQAKEEQRVAERRAADTANAYDKLMARQGRTLAGGQYLSAKQTLTEKEKEFDAQLKLNKKLLKKLAVDLVEAKLITAGLGQLLSDLTVGRTLVAVNEGLRKQLVDKLKGLGAAGQQAAKILQDSVNPYDVFVRCEAELDRASDLIDQPAGKVPANKLSLAEILARKKAAASRPAASDLSDF